MENNDVMSKYDKLKGKFYKKNGTNFIYVITSFHKSNIDGKIYVSGHEKNAITMDIALTETVDSFFKEFSEVPS